MSPTMSVRVAVIPAAGRGTRFLPFTKAVPKELLPLGPIPAIQLVVDECIGAGIEHIVVVTSHTKPALAAYLDPDQALVDELRAAGNAELAATIAALNRDVRFSYAYQDQPRGLGHAVGCGRDAVGDELFAVVLPDEIIGGPRLLAQMFAVAGATGGGVVGLQEVPAAMVHRYGIVEPSGPVTDGVVAVRSMVEKPDPDAAPSNLAIIGRYVLTPDIFAEIDSVAPGRLGEIQLTDAMRAQAQRGPFSGVIGTDTRHDTGNPLGWFEAVTDAMLAHPDHGAASRRMLAERLRG